MPRQTQSHLLNRILNDTSTAHTHLGPSGATILKLYPYQPASKSAKDLASSLGVMRLKHHGPQIRAGFRRGLLSHDGMVINWGATSAPRLEGFAGTVINPPVAVAKASNKLTAFNILQGCNVTIPEFTADRAVAQGWTTEGDSVYCRTVLSGHSGVGIVIGTNTENVVDAPLYTKNVKAKYEFRVHVMNGKIIDFQQKKKRQGFEGGISGIRNHANGWVFCREGVVLPPEAETQAIKAVEALGLDFGAVDIGYNERQNKAYVYEVNTAPGLEGTSLEKYTAAIKENYLG